MLAQSSPSYFSCMPTAFAIALDVPVRKLMAELGFDGNAIIFDDAEEPECRRAWHLQDLIKCCLLRGFAPVVVEAVPSVLVNGEVRDIPLPEDYNTRIASFMNHYKGVVMGTTPQGRRHALAWEQPFFYNTDGTSSQDTELEVQEFVALVPMRKELEADS